MIVCSYSRRSQSAKMLAQALGAEFAVRSVPRPNDTHVVNWGCSSVSDWNPHWLNHPLAVRTATNKLKTFRCLHNHGVRTPLWTESQDTADHWLEQGETIVCRMELSSSEGRGIIIAPPQHNFILPRSSLYTVHLKHEEEYRIHVFQGKVIKITLKCPRTERPDFTIRSHSRGWALNTRSRAPAQVSTQAISAVKAVGLDFGAVDIGYKVGENAAYVFEINTAPGLIESTTKAYMEAIHGYYTRPN